VAVPNYTVTERRRLGKSRVRVTARFADGTLVTTTVPYSRSHGADMNHALALAWQSVTEGRRF
jgi:hypothetical protein